MEAEARRCVDIGLKGFVLPDTPERVGVPSFVHDYWTPFLEMCNDTGMSLNFHLNAAMDPTALTWEGFALEQTLSVVAPMRSEERRVGKGCGSTCNIRWVDEP